MLDLDRGSFGGVRKIWFFMVKQELIIIISFLSKDFLSRFGLPFDKYNIEQF